MHEQYQAPLPVNSPALPEPFYYLHNFRAVLAWIGERYADLLDDQERAFIAAFAELPEASQALLVRMVMRKGTLFREGKLAYAEIGDTRAAVQPLLALGWVDAQPTLELAQLFGLLKKDELSQLFRDHLGRANLRKDALLERLQPLFPEARRLAEWQADFAEPVYELRCMALCDRLRLMYFGNLWQDWSEFVLADLGIYRYESVEFSADSRGFRLRADVDAYLHLFDCRQRFDLGEPLEELLAGLPGEPYANPWLEGRRVKLLFQFAQHCEKQRDFDLAQRLYRQSSHPGARLRAIRSLERGERFAEAHALAREASCAPESDAERQGLARLLPRLQGKLGLPRQARAAAPEIDRLDLCLAFPSEPCSVEWAVREHLEEPDCAVHYVENGLINSLFGLLCWEAIFAAIPGGVLPSLPQRAGGPAQRRLPPAPRRPVRGLPGTAGGRQLPRRDPLSLPRQVRPAVALRLLGTAWRGTARTGARLPTGGPPARLVRTPAGGYPGQPRRPAGPDPVLAGAAALPDGRGQGTGRPPAGQPVALAAILPRAGDAGGGLLRALACR